MIPQSMIDYWKELIVRDIDQVYGAELANLIRVLGYKEIFKALVSYNETKGR